MSTVRSEQLTYEASRYVRSLRDELEGLLVILNGSDEVQVQNALASHSREVDSLRELLADAFFASDQARTARFEAGTS